MCIQMILCYIICFEIFQIKSANLSQVCQNISENFHLQFPVTGRSCLMVVLENSQKGILQDTYPEILNSSDNVPKKSIGKFIGDHVRDSSVSFTWKSSEILPKIRYIFF